MSSLICRRRRPKVSKPQACAGASTVRGGSVASPTCGLSCRFDCAIIQLAAVGRTPLCCARGRPIIVEWERDARHSAGLSLVRLTTRTDWFREKNLPLLIPARGEGEVHRLFLKQCFAEGFLINSARCALANPFHLLYLAHRCTPIVTDDSALLQYLREGFGRARVISSNEQGGGVLKRTGVRWYVTIIRSPGRAAFVQSVRFLRPAERCGAFLLPLVNIGTEFESR
ncbi:hypothetical protein EVAR_20487_1 [Eumeta japonica]|uniref:Uncharacterized protein n=1 Tax=Eumeta variegata TaxID=151549 RepID=A0A4C1YA21_EUMVA|nr:hypothetical protein EVAR_20487_1 [Eumeta japonica]